ncbi:D-alanyl-D-alanine carboxypeptidase/D-alanyl-D-alanine carboxypeptidase (penicillin-binding protein 5/6) [Paenibacillus anaericanus]|uniref:D-alanyl-D-alanine carboxypeptidase family protein n=1 Tax=Paenibacillus anaericanus TaxID=170367 RepID=UPI002788AA86|nr:D-alanyl-D-alanine carboxypeptidase family protein [Paenibacillus anaericanus]MDQ0088812.1 D-alanyl-D-alanine carboxypeptidase/D-alanyl-D-alanine carboxypeptidase (penicillin-binding protein 5/6) [Paenibacillus anaericanus]
MKRFFALFLMLTIIFSVQKQTYAMESKGIQSLNSEAVILIDGTTGTILFEQDSEKLMYPASITKIVTGIIAIEEGNTNDIVTVSKNARNVDGTRVYLLEGEQVPMLKLIQGMLINSGNDAATAIAEHIDGSEAQFAERMNQFIRDKIGTRNTTFQNPHGLFDVNHVTTAYDMAIITQYAMNNPLFRSIVGTKSLEWIGKGWETTIFNHNRLLWRYEGTTGVKNGYVLQSGYTLVASAMRDGSEWIAVTLNAGSAELAYSDMENLFDYGFNNYQTNQYTVDPLLIQKYQDRFQVPDQLVFTSKKSESFKVELNENNGQLVVMDSNDNQVYSKQLIPLITSQHIIDMLRGPLNEESKSFLTAKSISIAIPVLLILLFVRKRKREKR